MNVRSIIVATLTISSLSLGCAARDDESEEASATATSALQAQNQDGVMDGVIDTEGDAAPEPEVVAQHVVDFERSGLVPAGCATKTRNGSVVTVLLDDCTGPFGRVVLKGALVATFSRPSSNDLHVEVVAKDLTANGRALSYAAASDVHFEGTKRGITYRGSSRGTTKRGKPFSRRTELAITADVATHCAKIDGTSEGSIGRYDVDLTISGFEGCRDRCPTAGVARATVDGPLVKDRSVEVTFDGSDQAHVKIVARKTRELDLALDCEANEAAE